MRTEKNLHLHELIGLKIEIVNSSCKKWIGLKGKIVDETKNLFIIKVNDKEQKIPKTSSVFLFTLENGEQIELKGKNILFRPEERTKKAL